MKNYSEDAYVTSEKWTNLSPENQKEAVENELKNKDYFADFEFQYIQGWSDCIKN